jgi:fatty acid desaturase
MTIALDGLGPVRTTKSSGAARGPSTFSSLAASVRDAGLLERARGFYLLVGIALAVALAGLGTAFVLLGDSWWQLLVAAALGLLLTQFAFMGHEASHRQILASGPANDRLGRFLAVGIVGISYAWWMTKHTRHHANPNRREHDPDVAWDTVSFLPEDAARQTGFLAALTRRQGYLFFPLLTLEGINLHFRGLQLLVSKEAVPGRWIELGMMAARWAIYLTVLFAFLPLGMAFAFLAVQLAVFGVYMGASFAPNHKGMDLVGADERLDFLTKQVRTSRDIRGGWWATTLFGGLNHQVVHHLFPSMARPNLSKARDLVREHCKTHGIPYTEATLVESYAAVIRYLNEVGLEARDPFDCPLVQRFRRR